MAQISTAYDLELFSPRRPRLVEMKNDVKAQQDAQRRARHQKLLTFAVCLVIAVMIVALVGYFITCRVRLTEMNKLLNDKQIELSALQSEEVRLKAEVENKTSAERVDAFVQENGMYPISSNQIYYIEASDQDEVILPENDTWLKKAWNAIVNVMS